MGFEIGNRVFDYEITGVLGAGGMGKVYKVRNVISDRVDALKILLPDLAHEPDLADRFLREIKVLASLNHPNIAAFHTALTFENQLIMVMEFVSGIAVSERLQQGPMPLREAVACIDQVLAALSYAHSRGVIHRDIKPANMMLTPEGRIKLMDFGIAKAAADPHLTRTGSTVGSLFYISPEQLNGSPMDARSDLYSLGVAMYEIMTGKRPFEGKSEFSLMKAHMSEAPRPPIEMNPALPLALNSVILLALAKSPEERFQSADAFRAALNEAAKDAAGTTAPVSPPAKAAGAQPARPERAIPLSPMAGQEAARGAGHRGAYMLLGALIAIIIIVASAVELPRWFRARAHSEVTPPAAASAPQTTPVAPPPSQAATSSASEKSATVALPGKPVSSGTGSVAAPNVAAIHRSAAKERSEAISLPASAVNSTQAKEQAEQAVQPQPGKPGGGLAAAAPAAADAAELQTLSDRMDQLAARADAVKSTFSNFQQQVGSTGQALRPDIVASESLMERYMDGADAALAAHNTEQAQHYQELAEKQIKNLESFFGR